jgi:hypothetical protein
MVPSPGGDGYASRTWLIVEENVSSVKGNLNDI